MGNLYVYGGTSMQPPRLRKGFVYPSSTEATGRNNPRTERFMSTYQRLAKYQ